MTDTRPTIYFRDSDRILHPGKIVCVGRNYAEHAREMDAPLPEKPVLFLKPASAVVQNGGIVRRPSFSSDLQHEVEMAIAIGRTATGVPVPKAGECIAGYGVALDMTLRDVQSEAKKKGLPWAVAKGFDTSAPISHFVERKAIQNPDELEMSLWVNGELRQNANTRTMLFSVRELVSYISSVFTLHSGDIIFTGTPKGVGTVVPGDLIRAELQDVGTLEIEVASTVGP